MRVVVLSSGGVDSSVMMLMLKKKNYSLFPLFIDYGQRSARAEWEACRRVCQFMDLQPERMDIQGFGHVIPSGLTRLNLDIEKAAFVPTRNLLFLTLGAAYGFTVTAYVIAIGVLANPIFPDQTAEFVEKAQSVISTALGINITILAPLISLNKIDTLRLAHKHGLPVEFTYSCHSGNKNRCGHCISCKERIAAEKVLSEEGI